MSVNCDDFLYLVQENIIDASNEIEFRNIISRAYYSSYHRLMPKLLNAPPTHSKLIDYLCNVNESYKENLDLVTLRKIGLILEQEKKKRVKADYFLQQKIIKRDAEVSIRHAEKFKEMLDAM